MCSGYPNYLGDDVVAKCGSVFTEYGLDPREVDHTDQSELLFYDQLNFNNVIMSGLTIIQVMTLEHWSRMLYNFQDTTNSLGAAIFFALVVVIGSFVSLNLVLA